MYIVILIILLVSEFKDLHDTIDKLDSCLDKLEQRNDDLYSRMKELLESSRQTRLEIQESQCAKDNSVSDSNSTEAKESAGTSEGQVQSTGNTTEHTV